MPVVYLLWSLKYGKTAGNNPWEATGSRMADPLAAAHAQFRGNARRHRGALRLPAGRPLRKTLEQGTRPPPMPDATTYRGRPRARCRSRRARSSSTTSTNRPRPRTWACGCSSATEILFFGGLFAAYTVYRFSYPHSLRGRPATNCSCGPGALDTAILLVSSFTMAMAVHAAQTGSRRLLRIPAPGGRGASERASWSCTATNTYRDFAEHHVPGKSFHLRRARARTTRCSFSSRSISDDRACTACTS